MPAKGVIDDSKIGLPYSSVYTNHLCNESRQYARYNKIIEVIMKLYFSILDTHFIKS